jgi:hypothetical protein
VQSNKAGQPYPWSVDTDISELLTNLEYRADEIAEEIAAATVAEVERFRVIRDAALHGEIRMFARHHLDAFVQMARTGAPPSDEMLAATRQRAARRTHQMVPLADQLQSYLIAQRIISAAIAREAGPDGRSRRAALELMAETFDYNIAVVAAVAGAYVEVVQGDLVELDADRRELVDTMLRVGSTPRPELSRRAIGLGLDPCRSYMVVLAVVDSSDGQRWLADVIGRASGRPQQAAFVVIRDGELIAVLDADGTRAVLRHATAAVHQAGRGLLRAGVGPAFGSSYDGARRALRQSSARRAVVFSPDDIRIFDELLATRDQAVSQLVPDAIRRAVGDASVVTTLKAFVDHDLNVADAAKALSLHPNSLRYRLRRITRLTGRDPRRVTDLLELIAATEIVKGPEGL